MPTGYQMVPFDIKWLFTNIQPKSLFLYTKNVEFMYKGEIYIQINGVAMRLALTTLLADNFTVELERSAIPKLTTIN